MSKSAWISTVGALCLGLAFTSGAARAQGVQKDLPGPIDSLQDLEDTGKMLFKLADENGDNQISQKEAIDAGNLIAGGFFFRADANGDGTLSRDEAKAARDSFLKDHPWLKYAMDTVQTDKQKQRQGDQATPANTVNALKTVVAAFDTNNDKQLQANELRQAVQTSVQGLYASADTNRDGQLSPSEVNAAMIGGTRAVAQAAFQKADADRDGALSEAEFDQAIRQPVHVVFEIVDLNHDGKLTPDELQRARRGVMGRILAARLPEPENSLKNLIRSGRAPSQVAPVPTFGTPASNRPQTPPAENATPAQP